ncbi:MAG: bacillithiol system redox-active protein YtxJ [bacterium]|nr:bacillithiol system redox-active protein YtxJ [bacterium]
MNWKNLESVDQLDALIKASFDKPIAIFKHSTRCSISSMSLSRIERNWDALPTDFDLYYLDLLTYRPVSDAIAFKLGVEHQSPQLLLIENGQCTYHANHSEISISELLPLLKAS